MSRRDLPRMGSCAGPQVDGQAALLAQQAVHSSTGMQTPRRSPERFQSS